MMGNLTMSYDLPNITVLVVEDNIHMQALIRGVLKEFNVCDTHAYTNDHATYDALMSIHLDLAIVDWEMKLLNSIEFTTKVRMGQQSPNPFLPTIMLSGYSDRVHVVDARDAGVTEYVRKPSNFSGRSEII
jgi:two-component system chemotaxis response regulator CheY